QHDSQHEPVQIHGPGNSLACHRLFHQGLESEFLQHGDYRQQPAVGSQILTREIIGRGSIDFIGLRSTILRALFSARFTAILFLVRNHLGDLLGGRFCEASTSQFSVLPKCSRGPQMVRYALAFRRAPAKAHSSGGTLSSVDGISAKDFKAKPVVAPKRVRPPRAVRTNVVPKSCKLNITNAKIEKIYGELRILQISK